MAVAPPPEWLASGWLPFIRAFFDRAVSALQRGQDVTSWFRSPDVNARVGGNKESQHLLGLAFDVTGPDLDRTLFLARRAGLVAVHEGSHVHLQLFGPGVLGRAGVVFPRAGGIILADRGETAARRQVD